MKTANSEEIATLFEMGTKIEELVPSR